MRCTTLFSVLALSSVVVSISTAPYPYTTGAKQAGMRAVGYYGNWDIYARNFSVLDIPTAELSHIMYAFANVNNATGEVFLSDVSADLQRIYPGDRPSANKTNDVFGAIKQLYLLKKKNRSLKTMLSIGGSTYSPNFPPVLTSAPLRAKFAVSAIKLMTDLGFDGLDIDYEYVQNAAEASGMVDLLSRLREGMTESANASNPFLLSYASPAGPQHYKALNIKAMDKYLDFWNYMGFDYAGPWDTIAAHASNLYPDSSNPLSTPFDTASAISYYINVGMVSPSKINLGSPLYGRSFANTAGPGTPFNGTGLDGSFNISGIWDYKDLPAPGYHSKVIELTNIGASYSYDAQKKYMVSYDTPTIATVKAHYVQKSGLGGSMWWEVSMDKTGAESLIGTTVNVFRGAAGLDSSLNHLYYPYSPYDNLKNGMPDN